MRKRGRKPWWRKVWTPEGSRDMTEAEEIAIKQRGIEQNAETAELITTWKNWARAEKLLRIASTAFVELRQQGVKERVDVEDRNDRINEIAKKISANGWLGKSNSWIAHRLLAKYKRSVNTLRADVAAAKKISDGQSKAKKITLVN